MVTMASALAVKLQKVRSVAGDEPPAAWLRRRYVDELASYRELAEELGYADSGARGVRSLLEHFGIPVRRGGEAIAAQWVNAPERRAAFGAKVRDLKLIHGESGPGARTREYKTWMSMHERCSNPSHHAYASYGGRGITVCERWKSYPAFLADMGRRPKGCVIDRIDNDKGYEPSNCRWASRKQSTRNRRCARTVEVDGKKVSLADVCEKAGVSLGLTAERLARGWPLERALRMPRRARRDHLQE